MAKNLFLAVSLWIVVIPLRAETKSFRLEEFPLAGTWESAHSRYYVTYWGDTLYLIRSADGKAWTLLS